MQDITSRIALTDKQVIEHLEESDPAFPTNDFIRNKIESERSVFLSHGSAAIDGDSIEPVSTEVPTQVSEETVITETSIVQVRRTFLRPLSEG